MTQTSAAKRLLPVLLWVLTLAFLALWAYLQHRPIFWDLDVYHKAILSLRAGHEPYADGVARQILIRDHPELNHSKIPPFTYPYSPITLPLLRWIALLPLSVTGSFYLLFYAAGVAVSVYVCLQIAEPEERRIATLLSPLVLYFPGLVYNPVVLSGNIAYLIYGLVFTAALLGWRRGRWLWFYIAVLLVSCIKAPLLILLGLPVLSARRAWLPTAVTSVLGVGIFAIQPHLWPVLFRDYLTAVELQFSINHDFGASPNGIIADTLFNTVPYKTTATVVYLLYAIPIALLLLYLRRRFLDGLFSLRQWIPVLMLGVTLLNPRIMEYDIAPITLLMGLTAWRVARRHASIPISALICGLFFLAMNSRTLLSWRPVECLTLGIVFFLGAHYLLTMQFNAHADSDPTAENLTQTDPTLVSAFAFTTATANRIPEPVSHRQKTSLSSRA